MNRVELIAPTLRHEKAFLAAAQHSRALRRGFGELGLHRVEANIQSDNVPSKRLVERLGFRCEGFSPRHLEVGGRWRDHERWALLAEEFRAGRSPSHSKERC
jgi:RimJ/RimL family protein N-acetyltransferase